jgi:predicted nucleotidyltransferase
MIYRMDRLFGSRTRVTLLSKLMMDSDRQFYIRELSKDLEIPYSMLYKEAKNLVSLGIITEERRGKITLLAANKKLHYFLELKSLLKKTTGLSDLMKSALSRLRGIRYALIYGSFAGEEETTGGDVNLLIVGELDEWEVLKATSEIEKDVGLKISYTLWSQEEFLMRAAGKHHLLVEILEKPFIMLVGDEHEFRSAAGR